MKVTLVQMNSSENKKENQEKVMFFLHEAKKENPDVICLSELFLYWGNEKEKGIVTEEELEPFKTFAKEENVNLILGSVSMKKEQEKMTNTCFVIDREGKITARYDKKHMYKVYEPVYLNEEEDTISGKTLGIALIDGIKIGIGICFDIRFPEYFRDLIKQGVEVIFLPANFNENTGLIAWDILVPARAIENQVYFCACNQTGEGVCGKTKVISYDGKPLKEMGKEEGWITVDLDLESQRKFRESFPILEQMDK